MERRTQLERTACALEKSRFQEVHAVCRSGRIHEPLTQRPARGAPQRFQREDLLRECRMALDEVVEHLAHGRAVGLDLACASDLVAERGGNVDDRHDACTAGPWQNST